MGDTWSSCCTLMRSAEKELIHTRPGGKSLGPDRKAIIYQVKSPVDDRPYRHLTTIKKFRKTAQQNQQTTQVTKYEVTAPPEGLQSKAAASCQKNRGTGLSETIQSTRLDTSGTRLRCKSSGKLTRNLESPVNVGPTSNQVSLPQQLRGLMTQPIIATGDDSTKYNTNTPIDEQPYQRRNNIVDAYQQGRNRSGRKAGESLNDDTPLVNTTNTYRQDSNTISSHDYAVIRQNSTQPLSFHHTQTGGRAKPTELSHSAGHAPPATTITFTPHQGGSSSICYSSATSPTTCRSIHLTVVDTKLQVENCLAPVSEGGVLSIGDQTPSMILLGNVYNTPHIRILDGSTSHRGAKAPSFEGPVGARCMCAYSNQNDDEVGDEGEEALSTLRHSHHLQNQICPLHGRGFGTGSQTFATSQPPKRVANTISHSTRTTCSPSSANHSIEDNLEESLYAGVSVVILLQDGARLDCRLVVEPETRTLVIRSGERVRFIRMSEIQNILYGPKALRRIDTRAQIEDDPNCVAIHLEDSGSCIPLHFPSQELCTCFIDVLSDLLDAAREPHPPPNAAAPNVIVA